MTIQQYLTKVETLYKTGNAREHSYRGDLQNLIMAILPDILVTNEPARVACGAPDYVLTRKDIPVGYIEAKDIGVDLGSKTLKEQFDRYKSGLSNLVFTDYMDFHFYKDGELTTKIAIAKLENGTIVPQPENFDQFTQLIKNFAETISQTIKSPTKLAQMMAGKAKLMADVIEKSLNYDDQEGKRSTIKSQMLSFQQMLIHDIDNKSFADIYSQTIAYGMFAARYHDPTLPTFSRMEAAELIPKSNPFLRKLFQDIAGFDLDMRLTWIVDELVNIFLASDVSLIMKNFGKSTKQEDPVVHFYETFLGEYNPALRKARGVWYTPQPVVNFIVRAVDDILKTEFDLPQGLADTSKIKIKKKAITQTASKKNAVIKEVEVEHEVHKVQILDPATGTGTFLAEVVKHIHKKFEGQQGIWSKYVTKDLIPRLNGFELLMASYAMAHLKMDMLLTETGYKPTDDQRFRIFLTNSLEEAHPDTGTLFSSWLSDEADQANAIKRDAPVMVVIGNPPYSVSSTNKSKWIEGLTADYKKDMKERNIQPLSDDYIKFIRFGQHFIDKNGEGVLAYISNNSFIDGIIHRQMRKHLLESFDKIYILDLHGNAKKKEVCLDGSPDQNVFDIMQGVSINIFVKTGKKKKNELGDILHFDLQGKRDFKYNFLNDNSLKSFDWTKLEYKEPNFFFVNKNFDGVNEYEKGFNVSDLFLQNSVGVVTSNDSVLVAENISNLKIQIEENYKDEIFDSKYVNDYLYRPFEMKKIYFKTNLLGRSREKVMKNFYKPNIGLIISKQFGGGKHFICFITNTINDKSSQPFAPYYNHSLYLYPETDAQQTLDGNNTRVPNLNPDIIKQIADGLGMTFTNEKETETNVCFANSDEVRPEFKQSFAPIDLLDYIYAVLHSPSYREKYKEFLKIEFPRVPAPQDRVEFMQLVKLGGELRQIHLLESPTVEKYITQYPEDGDNIVTKPVYKNGNVYINDDQHFANVPEVAWNFYIGGYQPCQKWLKDRKGRELNYDDILHYQKMVVALTETDRIMKEIDKIKI
ncbi:type ISP restriction/modification enzyme [Flavobacterium yafengii]|uniref:type ISP restriction/modification enzyme n=1 Tax=Flavobacterium yafengii TaxID=3041253 RepID=UPI0024A8232A|nr:type ISP restriction/modification enzyme [Flavobacterium yafengii]MDI5898309.1 N-6 DNA methylase [Flavobacterium yafengii]